MLKEKVEILNEPTATGKLTALSLKMEPFSETYSHGPGRLLCGGLFIILQTMLNFMYFIEKKNFCRKSLRTLPLNEKKKERVSKLCTYEALQTYLLGVKKHCTAAIKTKFKILELKNLLVEISHM